MGEVDALMKELTESGELVGGEALADPSNTKTVRGRASFPVITDGPFAEAKEHLGGYLVVDCESLEGATEIAARWPNAPVSWRWAATPQALAPATGLPRASPPASPNSFISRVGPPS